MPVKKGIVINRMYVGDYLTSNLGHEIINLFLADNGCHYLYLNSNGSFSKEHKDIDCMLMVKSGPKNCFEVIAIATGLKSAPGAELPRSRNLNEINGEILNLQKQFIKSQPGGDVKYGDISILDIFSKEEQQSVFITYKASEVFTPKGGKRILLHYDKKAENVEDGENIYIAITEHNQPKTSLKSYIYPLSDSDCNNILKNLIEKEDFWESGTITKICSEKLNSPYSVSLFEICQIQNDENRLSNALAYFMNMKEYFSLWKDFFANYNIELHYPIEVKREVHATTTDSNVPQANSSGGRIDMLISDSHNIIVIENKIKSDINRVEDDSPGTNQLDRYKRYGREIGIRRNIDASNQYFFILAPEYQRPHLQDNQKEFKFISYKDLYEHLNKSDYDEILKKDNNFKAFRDVIFRHTLTSASEYLYYEMLEKFKNRINQTKQ